MNVDSEFHCELPDVELPKIREGHAAVLPGSRHGNAAEATRVPLFQSPAPSARQCRVYSTVTDFARFLG